MTAFQKSGECGTLTPRRSAFILTLTLGLCLLGFNKTLHAQIYTDDMVDFVHLLSGPVRYVSVCNMRVEEFGKRKANPTCQPLSAWCNVYGDIERWGHGNDTLRPTAFYRYDSLGRKQEAVYAYLSYMFENRQNIDRWRLIVEQNLYRYDSCGRLTESLRYRLPGDTLLARTTFTYDASGRIIGKTYDRTVPPIEHSVFVYEYALSGAFVIRKKSHYEDYPQGTSITSFDARGFTLGWEWSDVSDSGTILRQSDIYINDSLGNPVVEISRWQKGGPDTTKYTYEYDKHGNWTVRRTFRRVQAGYHSPRTGPYHCENLTRRRIEYYDEREIPPSRRQPPSTNTPCR